MRGDQLHIVTAFVGWSSAETGALKRLGFAAMLHGWRPELYYSSV